MNKWTALSLLVFLIGAAMWDVVSRSFPVWWLALFAAVGVGEWFLLQGNSAADLFPAVLPGAALWLAGRRLPGMIGEGDGALMTVAGTYLGLEAVLKVLFSGLIFAGVFGLILTALRGIAPARRLPFAPFALLGFAAVVILC